MGASVVDYAAWERGYTPPSEHILIDQLAYRGARVMMMSDFGDDLGAVWVVIRGKALTPAMRRSMRHMLEVFTDDKLDDLKAKIIVSPRRPGEWG
jgi:hypothetical protein